MMRTDARFRNLRQVIRDILSEMSTRYRREKGENLPRWKERLMQYADDGEHFVHFSFFPKLGLNPLNDFDTPTGFYMYPLQKGKISSFATDRPYAIVTSLKGSGNFLRLSDYTDVDLQRDIESLRDEEGLSRRMEEDARQTARVNTPGGILWNITRLLATSREREKGKEKNPAWTRKKENYYEEILWVAEMLAGLKGRERRAAIEEFRARSEDRKNNRAAVRRKWSRIYNLARNMPANVTPAEIRRRVATQKEFMVNPRMSDWTGIFRRLGYEGVIDDGEKIIHPSEPFQAVFFSTRHLDPVDVIKKEGQKDLGDLKAKDDWEGYAGDAGENLELDGEHFKGKLVDWIGQEPSNVIFTDCTFEGVDASDNFFSHSEISNCTVIDTDFTSADFVSAYLNDTLFTRVNFSGASTSNTTFDGSTFIDCTFSSTNMATAAFRKCTFTGCSFQGANFQGATFISTLIKSPDGDLSDIELSGADVSGLSVLPDDTALPVGFLIVDETGQVAEE